MGRLTCFVSVCGRCNLATIGLTPALEGSRDIIGALGGGGAEPPYRSSPHSLPFSMAQGTTCWNANAPTQHEEGTLDSIFTPPLPMGPSFFFFSFLCYNALNLNAYPSAFEKSLRLSDDTIGVMRQHRFAFLGMDRLRSGAATSGLKWPIRCSC